MSVIQILGANNYTLVGTRKEYDQESGESTVTTYQGPIDKIDELYAETRNDVIDGLYDKVTTGKKDGMGQLEISVSDSGDAAEEDTNTVWELVGQDIYKNIRSYNGDVTSSEAFNKDTNQTDLENTRLFFETAGQEGVDPGDDEPQATYLQLLMRGTDQYVRSIAVLRSRITVSRRSQITCDWTGVDRAWRLTGDSASGGPNLNLGQAALLGQISSMPEADDTKKQWLKRAPSLTMTGSKSYTMTQEWWFARAWSENLYDGDAADGNP
jgi:hypothetical protein